MIFFLYLIHSFNNCTNDTPYKNWPNYTHAYAFLLHVKEEITALAI